MAPAAPPITAEAKTAGEELVRELPRLPAYPALFQLNTRVRLRALEAELGRSATLDDIPDAVRAGPRGRGGGAAYISRYFPG